MNRFSKFAAMSLCMVLPLLNSCKGNDPEKKDNNPLKLVVDKHEINLPAEGGSVELQVTTNALNVSVQSKDFSNPECPTWYKIDDSEYYNYLETKGITNPDIMGDSDHTFKFAIDADAALSTLADSDSIVVCVIGAPAEEPGRSYYKYDTIILTRAGQKEIDMPEGALIGRFSVSEDLQVLFAKGNLRYNTNKDEWRFADKQTECLRGDQGTVIDLFAWGATGYNGTQPTLFDEAYMAAKPTVEDLAGTGYDWGQHCAIANGGNQPGIWRTLSRKEWNYLLFERPDAELLHAYWLDNVYILPDNWRAIANARHLIIEDGWKSLSEKELTEMGVLILPESYTNYGTNEWDQVRNGLYWSTDALNSSPDFAYCFWFDANHMDEVKIEQAYKGWGLAVRLVHDVK